VPSGVNLESLVHAFSRLKSRGLLGDLKQQEVPDISVSLRAMHETYRGAVRAAGALDFGDLVLECVRLFTQRPQVLRLYRVAFRHVLVGELPLTPSTPRPNATGRSKFQSSRSWPFVLSLAT
jgi:ATP-dependent exoDNAse (exonuclease V) beta subunit